MNALLLSIALLTTPPPPACPVEFVNVEPERPTSNDEIELHVGGTCPNGCSLHPPFVTAEGNRIEISIESGVCLLTPADWGKRVRLGKLPGGTYEVKITVGRVQAAQRTFTVQKAPFLIMPAFGNPGTQVAVHIPNPGSCPLAPCSEFQVTFDGVKGNVTAFTDGGTRAIVTVPPHAPGRVDVAVTNYSGQTVALPGGFLYPEPFADLSAEYERVILPAVFSGPGAHGSQWTSENVVMSRASVAMPSLPVAVPEGRRVSIPPQGRDGGLLFYMPRGFAPFLFFSSHVRDLSRNASDAGTELPIVRARDTSNDLHILDVPVNAASRRLLRVYDFDAFDGCTVNVYITPAFGGTPQTRFLTLRDRIICVTTPCYPDRPTWAALPLDDLPPGVYDLEIQGVPDDARLWAFVTVTNNDTQHVTAYTPQRGQ